MVLDSYWVNKMHTGQINQHNNQQSQILNLNLNKGDERVRDSGADMSNHPGAFTEINTQKYRNRTSKETLARSTRSQLIINKFDLENAKRKVLRFVWIEHTTFRYHMIEVDFSLTLSQLS